MNTGIHTLARHMQAELLDALQMSRVVNLIGPRQVGKTTLVRDLYGGGEFLTLDNEATLSAIEADAAGLLSSKRTSSKDAPLVIDEAQRSRSLALAIKRFVDEDRRRGQFLGLVPARSRHRPYTKIMRAPTRGTPTIYGICNSRHPVPETSSPRHPSS